MPRIDRKTVRFSRAKPILRQVSLNGLTLTTSSGAGGGASGYCDWRDSRRRLRRARPWRSTPRRPGPGKQAAGQRPDQDGDEGSGLDLGVAADQFILVQMLRQDGVLDRPEQRRLQAEEK